jgi:outer membrane immunogenic protein
MRTSQKLAIVAMVSGFGLSVAHAADMPNHKQAPAPAAPMAFEAPAEFSWTGFHIGGNIGGIKFHKMDNALKNEKNPIATIGGIQAGYDHQFGSLVLGLEGDANFSAGPVAKIGDFKTSVDRMFTVRGRAGYAADRTLLYVTGGWTNLRLKPNKALKAEGLKAQNRNGWNIGGGLEYALTDNLSARAEYLYSNLPKVKEVVDGQKIVTAGKVESSMVRVGLNYKF